jgi:hypothetical protein
MIKPYRGYRQIALLFEMSSSVDLLPAVGMVADDDDQRTARTEAANRKTMAYLVAGFACWMFGAQLTRASQVELLLSTFKGGESRRKLF